MIRNVIFLITMSASFLKAQNLVPNPSFEEFDQCPFAISQLYHATDWTINVNTTDYFNGCISSSLQVSVPSNALGFQYPVSGNAYAGFAAKGKNISGDEAREYFGAMLSVPLVAGERYYLSFSLSPNAASCYINRVGVLFTNLFLGDSIIVPSPLINNFAHVFTDSIVSDTSSWTRIAGSFVADSNYQYIMIGNFFDNLHIDSNVVNGLECFAYYYVDDICVSADSLVCTQNIPNLFLVSTGYTSVSCAGFADGSAYITVSGGLPPYHYNWSNGATSDTISNLSAGTYIVTVTDSVNNIAYDTVTVSSPDELIIAISSFTAHVTCYGNNDGAAKTIASGGTPPYSFAWSDGQTSDSPTGFLAGEHGVTVTDSNGCTGFTSITIQEGQSINAGNITGADSSLIFQSHTYSVRDDTIYIYSWSVTHGNIIYGQNTNTVEVGWDSASNGTIQLIAEQEGCYDTVTKTIVLLKTTGIHEVANDFILFYNQQSNIISFHLPHPMPLTIYNGLGQIVFTSNKKTEELQINTINFPAGVYLVNAGAKTVRFLIKR